MDWLGNLFGSLLEFLYYVFISWWGFISVLAGVVWIVDIVRNKPLSPRHRKRLIGRIMVFSILMALFMAFHKVRAQRDRLIVTAKQEREVSDKLGLFYYQGLVILHSIEKADEPFPRKKELDWEHNVADFLYQRYGRSRVAEFHKSGVSPKSPPTLMSRPHNRKLWARVEIHLRQLQEIIKAVAPKKPIPDTKGL